MKRIVTLILALIMIFALTACGEKEGKDSTDVTKGQSQSETGAQTKDTGVKFTQIVKGYTLDAEGRIWKFSLVENPTVFCDAAKFTFIHESNGFACAIDEDGGLWAWSQSSEPQKILDGVKMATGNYDDGYAIKTDGTLYQWSKDIAPAPVEIDAKFNYVAAGGSIKGCVAIDTDGNRYIWGANCNVLGCEAAQIDPSLADAPSGVIPNQPKLVQNDTAAKGTYYFATGTSYLIDTNGTLYISGGKGSKLDPYETTGSFGVYTKVVDKVAMIAPAMYGTLYIDTDGNIWGWGSDAFKICAATTKPVQITKGTKYVDVVVMDSGSTMAYAIADDGNIYTFGEKNSAPTIVEVK